VPVYGVVVRISRLAHQDHLLRDGRRESGVGQDSVAEFVAANADAPPELVRLQADPICGPLQVSPGILGRSTPVSEAEHVGFARLEAVRKSGKLQQQRADGPQRVVSESLDCDDDHLVVTIAAISVGTSSILS
jgi:hypothetical protein